MGRRSDHTRPQIRAMAIDAARAIVQTEGYGALSARNVARRIGYAAGTLYVVFENLDELALILKQEALDQLHARMQHAIESTPAEQRLGAAMAAYVSYASEHSQRWRMVFEHRDGTGMRPPESITERLGRIVALVAQAVRTLAPQRSREELQNLAGAVWSGVHGICILTLTGRLPTASTATLPGLTASLVEHFTAGLNTGD